jgi:hypothetical protein
MSNRPSEPSSGHGPRQSIRKRPARRDADPAVEQVPVSDAMRIVIEQAISQARTGLFVVLVVAGVAALVGVGLVARQAATGAPPAGQESNGLGSLAVAVLGAAAFVWAWRQLQRSRRLTQGPGSAAGPCVRAAGQVILLLTYGQKSRLYRLRTPNGDFLRIDGAVHDALVPSAVASDENVRLTRPSTWDVSGKNDVWLIEPATVLYHPSSGALLEVHGPDGALLHRHPSYRPDAQAVKPPRPP